MESDLTGADATDGLHGADPSLDASCSAQFTTRTCMLPGVGEHEASHIPQ